MTESLNIPDTMPVLSRGPHFQSQGKACLLEYIAVLAGEQWTDMPHCTLPMLAAAGQTVNDMIDDDDQRSALLVPLVGRLLGSSATGKFNLHQVQAQLAQYALGRIIRLGALDGRPNGERIATARRYATLATEAPVGSAVRPGLDKMTDEQQAEYWRVYAPDTTAAQEVARMLIADALFIGGPGLAVSELSQLIDEYDLITDRTAHRPMTRAELVTAAKRAEGR